MIEYDSIQQHIEKYIGQISNSFWQQEETVVITYFIVSPNVEHPYYTIVTCSTSTVESEQGNMLEFCLSVPMSWVFLDNAAELIESKDPKKLYPIRLLKEIAKFNISIEQLGAGHTIGTSRDSPFPKFKNIMLHFPLLFNEEFGLISSDTPSLIFGIYPLFKEEYLFKVNHSSDELMDRLSDNGSMIFDPDRKNICV